jgi:L-iditol 2-dehydrogenase
MSEKMKAVVIKDVKDLKIEEFDLPKPAAYEVLFQLKAVSLCTVEQRAYMGAKKFGYPFIGGHENSGVVAAVGDHVTDFKVGDKVAGTFGYCGHCAYCKTGRGTQCLNIRKNRSRIDFKGMIIGGGLAQYLAIPSWQLIKLDDHANFEHCALIEPLACCTHSVMRGRVNFGDTVLIIGSGIMGYLHMKLCKLSGARVIISEVDDARRNKAKANGADLVVNPLEQDIVEFVKSHTNGLGADVVFNTISNPSVWESAIKCLAPYGRLVAYSSQDNNEPVGMSFGEMHSKEYEFIGTVSPTMESNLRASRLINLGLIDMEEVIDSRYRFEDSEEAFKRACEPNTYRVVIKHE